MQVTLPFPSSSTHNNPTTYKQRSRPPSRRPSFASSHTHDGVDMDYEVLTAPTLPSPPLSFPRSPLLTPHQDYTMVHQDLANVHFRFEEEEEYLTDLCVMEENPFHTPTEQSYLDVCKDTYLFSSPSPFTSPHIKSPSPTHTTSNNGTQHKLKRSFGMENISPLYLYNKSTS